MKKLFINYIILFVNKRDFTKISGEERLQVIYFVEVSKQTLSGLETPCISPDQ